MRTSTTRTRSWSIQSRLLMVALLFLANGLGLEGLSTYIDSRVAVASAEAEMRRGHVEVLNSLETAAVELILAGMDAIIDKDSGVVAPELEKEMAETAGLWREKLPMIKNMADTENERKWAGEIEILYQQLETAVRGDLPKLIAAKADRAAFDAIDDRIDGLGQAIDQPLMSLIDSLQNENAAAAETLRKEMAKATLWRRVVAGSLLLTIIAGLWLIGRGILLPIKATSLLVADVAQGEGDLTKRLETGGDEIGVLSSHFNTFLQKLHGIISRLRQDLDSLSGSAGELTTLSKDLAVGSEDTTGRATTVAAAAEELSTNMQAVAAASEEAAANIGTVAAAAEEMNTTVTDIAEHTEKARKIALEAVDKTEVAAQRVDKLGEAASDISKVTEVITEISEQTNLLALNATIEAARAGEAGKGFAVVANAIKELARQTAGATLEIRRKIEAIQSSTDLTITEITEISTSIGKVSTIVDTIATSIAGQSATTGEIAANISQAAQGIAEVNENVAQSSTVAAEIAQEISGVSRVAEALRASSGKVDHQSGELAALAERLNTVVRQFKL